MPLVDTVVTAETPEGICIAMHPAGFPVRCAAFIIDGAIRLAILSTVGSILTTGGFVGRGLLLITLFVVNWLYPVIFELLPGAASPGKRIMGLQVMMANGLPITPAGCLTRNLLRAADFLPALYAFGIVCMLLRRDSRRIGDLAGGTLVVYRSRNESVGVIGDAAPTPPAIALTTRQKAAIAAFAWRVNRLTPERAEEIALLAVAVMPPTPTSTAMAPRLVGIARWLYGQRRAADSTVPT